MSDKPIIKGPGFRGEVVGQLGAMTIIDAQVSGDIPAHAAETDEFAVVLSGRFAVRLEGSEQTCAAGDYLLVPAGMSHAIRVLEPGRLILIGAM
ncbi:cupin domain-containing protein [Pseudochelatococcus contaminans]|uniref:Quercetin dioxygenase-like cupin family protein n=1 Tax=Pseudochelatococcus contaminans TaxID=1538103 RepID=A0A7W6EHX5_9HYPH|nr:cupin domain-containing protein [Pseudochelatococcus contaminans]MBB3810468.1 quercetin dioxygenase-like cupin family protein [Pseudochelatococcus contaminans]